VPQEAPSEPTPFFATEDAFLQAVYDNWTYFIRYLLKRYRWLCEQERETGSRAPVNAGWYVPIMVPKAHRRFDALLKSCDVQGVLLDAIARCLTPDNASYYTQYTPIRDGRCVQVTTWFVSHVRSCAGSRIRAWKRRGRRAKPFPNTNHAAQDAETATMAVDTYMTRDGDTPSGQDETILDAIATHAHLPAVTGETVDAFCARGGRIRRMPARPAANLPADLDAARATQRWLGRRQPQTHTPRTAQPELGYSPDHSAWEARHDLQQLVACLTAKEQEILERYLDFQCVVSKAFAETLGYDQQQARSKINYIKKKMRQHVKRIEEFFPHNHDFGE
jgi:hypothetical protein